MLEHYQTGSRKWYICISSLHVWVAVSCVMFLGLKIHVSSQKFKEFWGKKMILQVLSLLIYLAGNYDSVCVTVVLWAQNNKAVKHSNSIFLCTEAGGRERSYCVILRNLVLSLEITSVDVKRHKSRDIYAEKCVSSSLTIKESSSIIKKRIG